MDKSKIDRTLLDFDAITLTGIEVLREYLKDNEGEIEIDEHGDRALVYIFNHKMDSTVEVDAKKLRLTEDHDIQLFLDYPYNDWISLYEDIYILPTIQNLLETIRYYG